MGESIPRHQRNPQFGALSKKYCLETPFQIYTVKQSTKVTKRHNCIPKPQGHDKHPLYFYLIIIDHVNRSPAMWWFLGESFPCVVPFVSAMQCRESVPSGLRSKRPPEFSNPHKNHFHPSMTSFVTWDQTLLWATVSPPIK